MVVPCEVVLDLQELRTLLQPVVIIIRFDASERLWMNAVDRNVHVPVVGILVHRGDALMVFEADRLAQLGRN